MEEAMQNPKRVPIVGVAPHEAETVEDIVSGVCEDCGAALVLSEALVAVYTRTVAAAGNVPTVICLDCAAPWLEAMARDGRGVIIGGREDALEMAKSVLDRREKQILAN
jgi:hypothetical protein